MLVLQTSSCWLHIRLCMKMTVSYFWLPRSSFHFSTTQLLKSCPCIQLPLPKCETKVDLAFAVLTQTLKLMLTCWRSWDRSGGGTCSTDTSLSSPETFQQWKASVEEKHNPLSAAACWSGGTATAKEGGMFTEETTSHDPLYQHQC